MAEVVAAGLLTNVVKIAVDKLSSAIAEQGNLAWNFSDDLEDMKDTMESIAAVLKDADEQSVQTEQGRLWLKRLRNAAQGISDMMDNYQDQRAQQVRKLLQAIGITLIYTALRPWMNMNCMDFETSLIKITSNNSARIPICRGYSY
jgi:hypothetical protein